MPTFNNGSVAKVLLGAVDQSASFQEVSFEREIDTAETSALGTTAKTYVPGLSDGTLELKGMFDRTDSTGIDALINDWITAGSVAFDYRPAGTASGYPKYTGTAIVTEYTIETTVDDMAAIELELQITGAVTRASQ